MHLISTCVLIVLCFVGHMASSAAQLRTYEGPYSLYRALNLDAIRWPDNTRQGCSRQTFIAMPKEVRLEAAQAVARLFGMIVCAYQHRHVHV